MMLERAGTLYKGREPAGWRATLTQGQMSAWDRSVFITSPVPVCCPSNLPLPI